MAFNIGSVISQALELLRSSNMTGIFRAFSSTSPAAMVATAVGAGIVGKSTAELLNDEDKAKPKVNPATQNPTSV